MNRFEPYTARTNHRGGGFSCEVVENDGSEDGKVIATTYGVTADAAEAQAKHVADALNAADEAATQAPEAEAEPVDEFADNGEQAWIDFHHGRDLSTYTPAALIYALRQQEQWGKDWKAEAESCHVALVQLVDDGAITEDAVNKIMGQKDFVAGYKALSDLLEDSKD